MNILGIITFSLMFGLALATTGEAGDAIVNAVNVRLLHLCCVSWSLQYYGLRQDNWGAYAPSLLEAAIYCKADCCALHDCSQIHTLYSEKMKSWLFCKKGRGTPCIWYTVCELSKSICLGIGQRLAPKVFWTMSAHRFGIRFHATWISLWGQISCRYSTAALARWCAGCSGFPPWELHHSYPCPLWKPAICTRPS